MPGEHPEAIRQPVGNASAEITSYREHPAVPPLRPWVICVWTQTVGPGDQPCSLRVLPDGCVDIVWLGEAPPVIAGPATRFQDTLLPPASRNFGVRFRPGAAAVVLGCPASELRDQTAALTDLWGRAATPWSGQFQKEEPSVEARLARIERFLIQRVASTYRPEPAVQLAVSALGRAPGARIEAVSYALGINVRQLHRRFALAVGYSPKRFQRIVRFQHLLALARRSPASTPLADLALELGYADQSHMTRDVRELSGTVPSELLGRHDSTLLLSDLFKTPAPSSG